VCHFRTSKALLTERGIRFEAVHLGDGLTMQGVKAASGGTTVPQIFVGGTLIGGSAQLARFLGNT
jgi:glutaredoxin